MGVNGGRCVALILLLCAATRAAASAGGDGHVVHTAGPLLNGNFEYTPNLSQMNGSRVMGPHAIPYWTVTGFVELIESGKHGDMILPVPEGAHAVRLGNDSSLQQQLSVTLGRYYSITFSAARTCGQSERLNVSIAPGDVSTGELPIQTVYTSSGWDSYAWAFEARQGVVSLVIHHGDDETEEPACGPIVDSFAMKMLHTPHDPNNMLKNGDFEEGPYITPGSRWGVLVPPMDEDATSPLPGWMVLSYSKVVKYIDSEHFAVPHGSRAVELVAGLEVALAQEVGTVPGSSYMLHFSVGDAGNRCVANGTETEASPMRVQVSTAFGGTSVVYYSHGTGGHARAEFGFTASGNSTRVVFSSSGYHTTSDGTGTLCGPVIDDVSLICVSQPHARRLLR